MTNQRWGNEEGEKSFKRHILKSTSGFGDIWILLPTDTQGKPPSWPTWRPGPWTTLLHLRAQENGQRG